MTLDTCTHRLPTILVDTVYLIDWELNRLRKEAIGWNPLRGGSYVFEISLKRCCSGTRKSRITPCELACFDEQDVFDIEQKWQKKGKAYGHKDMLSEMRNKIKGYYQIKQVPKHR